MKFKTFFYIIIITRLVFLSCKEKNREIYDGEYRIVGKINTDSVWNGEMRFYDIKSNKLTAMRTYKDGILTGPSIRYNDEGKVIDSVSFTLNKKMGYNYVYDNSGQLLQKVNFFYGRQIGATYTFEDSNIIEYSFQNFENNILYFYSFDPKIGEHYFADDSYLANSSVSECTIDGVEGISIFTYLITPPKIKISHCIYRYDSLNHIIDSFKIPHNNFYFEKFFPIKNKNENFVISINKYDSVKQKETVIINKLKSQYP